MRRAQQPWLDPDRPFRLFLTQHSSPVIVCLLSGIRPFCFGIREFVILPFVIQFRYFPTAIVLAKKALDLPVLVAQDDLEVRCVLEADSGMMAMRFSPRDFHREVLELHENVP